MSEGMYPYPEYKDSRLKWLGKIPAHWDERRGKYLFREIDERSQTGEEEQLSVSHLTGVTPRSEKNVTMFKAESYEGHKLCHPGDLAVNIMWAWMAALGVSKHLGVISPSYGVYRQRNQTYLPEYLDYLVRTPQYKAEYNVRSKGVTSSRMRLYSDQLLDIPFICPPIDEQRAIVKFLERESEQIDRFIANKKKLIELLNEQKQAIIHRAVTKGIDPNAKLRPSGIDWVGKIPIHWRILRCKYLFKCKKELNSEGQWTNVLSLTLRGVVNNDVDNPEGLVPASYDTYQFFGKGDFCFKLIDLENLSTSRIGLVHEDGIMSPAYVRLIINDSNMTSYMYYQFFDLYSRAIFNQLGAGVRSTLGPKDLLELPLIVPELDEMTSISNHIDERLAELNNSIVVIEKEVSLIREYFSRLVADAVLGRFIVMESLKRGVE